ncbi:hypothetical protein L3X38_029536 [Prunus dulcis]|uniref:Uncharacterized protein n=1 Tax=Prunus dulcis TaxID=3755 RepID=A0AAD4VS29_PRUDU|nr:hypothetical protein L3X38_029536 [Prunus dulcis]
MPRRGVTSVHKDKTSVARWMSKGLGGSLREASIDYLGCLDSPCGTSALRSARMQHKQRNTLAACRQHTGSARRQHSGRSCRRLAGRLCAGCWQVV